MSLDAATGENKQVEHSVFSSFAPNNIETPQENNSQQRASVSALKTFFEQQMASSQEDSKGERVYRRANTELSLSRFFGNQEAPQQLLLDEEEDGEINVPSSEAGVPGVAKKVDFSLDLSKIQPAEASSSSETRLKKKLKKKHAQTLDSSSSKAGREFNRSVSAFSLKVPAKKQGKGKRKQSNPERGVLSLVTPRPSNLRTYLSGEIGDDLNYYEAGGDTLPYLSGKKNISQFNKGLKRFVLTALKGSRLPEPSAQKIEEKVMKVCRKETEALFSKETDILSRELQLTESPRVKDLVKIVQKSGALLVPLIKRMNVCRQALYEYLSLKGGKSVWAENLALTLDILVKPDIYSDEQQALGLEKGKELAPFVETLRSQTGIRANSRTKDVMYGILGKERKQILAVLTKWCNSPTHLVPVLKDSVHQMSWESISVSNIPFIEHEWIENAASENPIDQISLKEVVRCFVTEESVIMKKIVINGFTFYDDLVNEAKVTQNEFLARLMLYLYQTGLDPSVDEVEAAKQAANLLKWQHLSPRQIAINLRNDPIPCLPMLQVCTMSAWGHGDSYFRGLFCGLFKYPYWTKLLQGIECRIDLNANAEFTVTQLKKYGTYPRAHPTDKESTFVNPDELLAIIPVSWSLTTSPQGWRGVLHIPHEIEIEKNTSEKQKWDVLGSVIRYTDLEDAGAELPPGSPRMKSSPNFTLQSPRGKSPRSPLTASSSVEATSSEHDRKAKSPRYRKRVSKPESIVDDS